MATGLPVSRIRRRRGIDWEAHSRASGEGSRKPQDFPSGLLKHTFLMWDFHKRFLPSAQAAFAADRALKWIFWVEDDIAFARGVTWPKIVKACGANPAPLTWLAYTCVRGKPRWGSHLVALHRAGMPRLLKYLDSLEAAGSEPLAYLVGLDTFCLRASEASAEGVGRIASKSWASQRGHEWKGRR